MEAPSCAQHRSISQGLHSTNWHALQGRDSRSQARSWRDQAPNKCRLLGHDPLYTRACPPALHLLEQLLHCRKAEARRSGVQQAGGGERRRRHYLLQRALQRGPAARQHDAGGCLLRGAGSERHEGKGRSVAVLWGGQRGCRRCYKVPEDGRDRQQRDRPADLSIVNRRPAS